MLIVSGEDAFRVLYLRSVIKLYDMLNRSSMHRRNARALRLLLLKLQMSIPQLHNFHFDKKVLETYCASDDFMGYIDQIMRKA